MGLSAQSRDVYEVEYDGYTLQFLTQDGAYECKVRIGEKPTVPTAIEIPSSVDLGEWYDYDVIGISEFGFQDCDKITSIVMPNTIREIDGNAFTNCTSMNNVDLPENLETIGSYAFSGCSRLVQFTVPASVTVVDEGAFSSCLDLSFVTFEDKPGEITFGAEVFSNCPNLESVTFGKERTIKKLTFGMFRSCESLSSIEIENTSIESIYSECFSGCSSLTNITLPATLVNIYEEAFYNCSNLTEVYFSDNSQIENIHEKAFAECNQLKKITFGNNTQLTQIGMEFSRCPIEEISFGDNSKLNEIINAAFSGVSTLKSFTFGDNPVLTSIGDDSFKYCTNLTNFTIPSTVALIGRSAFEGCEKLSSVIIPKGVSSIGNSTFKDCTSLTYAYIPNTVTTIVNYAFANCSKLATIECRAEEVPQSSAGIFDGCPSNMIIKVPANSVEAYKAKTPWNNYTVQALPIYGITNFVAEGIDLYSIKLSWDALSGASEYMIYRDGELLKVVTTTSYTDTDLDVLSEYCYTIKCEDEVSEEKCASPIIKTPEIISGEYGRLYSSKCIIIEYGKIDGVSTYHIYRDGEYYDECYYGYDNDEIVKYYDKNIETGETYCYQVKAVCEGYQGGTSVSKDSEFSEKVCVKAAQESPENFTAKLVGISSIELSWDPVQNADSYAVYQYHSPEESTIAMVVYTTSVTFENLSSDTEYCFYVTVTTGLGTSGPSNIACAKLGTIDVPENLKVVSNSSTSVDLTWDAVNGATGYHVYQYYNQEYLDLGYIQTNSSHIDGLYTNVEYCFAVTAVNENVVLGNGNVLESEYSEVKCVTTEEPENPEQPEDPEQPGDGVEENVASFKLYPNPVENELFIVAEMNIEEVVVYDIYGRKTMGQQVNEITSQQVVDVADLEAGVYFVKVITNNGEIVKRFVKE